MQVKGRGVNFPVQKLEFDPESNKYLIRIDDNENLAFWMEIVFTKEELEKAEKEGRILYSLNPEKLKDRLDSDDLVD